MTSKEERDRRREERLAAEQREAAAEQRRLMLGYAVAGGLTLAVVVGIFVVFASGGGDEQQQVDGEEIPEDAHIELQSGYVHGFAPDGRAGNDAAAARAGRPRARRQGRPAASCSSTSPTRATPTSSPRTRCPTTRPTRRPRATTSTAEQLADGAYREYPDPWSLVHSLEHGRIEIQYSPDLPEDDQLALKGVFDEDPDGMLLFPNPDMPYEVAATAWTQLLGCDIRGPRDARRDPRLPRHLPRPGPRAGADQIPDDRLARRAAPGTKALQICDSDGE